MTDQRQLNDWLRAGLPKTESVTCSSDVTVHRVGGIEAQTTAVSSIIRQTEPDETVAIALKDESGDFSAVIDVLHASGIDVSVEVPAASRTNPVRLELEALAGAAGGETDSTIRLLDRFRHTDIGVQDLLNTLREADSLTEGLEIYLSEAEVIERLLGGTEDAVFDDGGGTPAQQAAIDFLRKAMEIASFIDESDGLGGGWAEFATHLESLGGDEWSRQYQLDANHEERLAVTSIMQLDRQFDIVCVLDLSMATFDQAPSPSKLFAPGSPGWREHPTVTNPSATDVARTFSEEMSGTSPKSSYWRGLHARQLGIAISWADSEVHLLTPDPDGSGDAMPSALAQAITEELGAMEGHHDAVATARKIRATAVSGEITGPAELESLCAAVRADVESAPAEVKARVQEELAAAIRAVRTAAVDESATYDETHTPQ